MTTSRLPLLGALAVGALALAGCAGGGGAEPSSPAPSSASSTTTTGRPAAIAAIAAGTGSRRMCSLTGGPPRWVRRGRTG